MAYGIAPSSGLYTDAFALMDVLWQCCVLWIPIWQALMEIPRHPYL